MWLKTFCLKRLLLVSLYICGAVLLWQIVPKPHGHYDVDSYGYDAIAWYFAQTGTLTDPNNINSAPIQPVGYHFVMGVLFMLFGHSYVAVIWFQIVMMILCILFLMRIANMLFGKETALWVGLLAVCNPGFVVYPQLLLAETMLLLVILCFFERYIVYLKERRVRDLIASLVSLGTSLIIKPIGLLMIVPAFFIGRRPGDAMRYPLRRYALLCAVAFCAPVMLYMTRNAVCYGTFAFAPMGPLNMYQCFLSKVIGAAEDKDPQEIIDTRLKFQAQESLDASGWSCAKDQFYAYLSAHPILFVKVWICNVLKSWFGLYATQLKRMLEPDNSLVIHSYFNQRGTLIERIYQYVAGGTSYRLIAAIAWYEFVYAIIRLMLALLGMHLLWRTGQRKLFWFFLSIMLSFSILTGIDGCCRYRMSFEPVLLLAAGVTLIEISAVYKAYKNKEHWYGVYQ